MNAKALIPLIAGLGIAGLAAKLGLDFIKKAEGKQVTVVKLWTPVEDIKRGVAIHEMMLRPLAFPEKALPPGALANIEKIVGRVPHTGAPAGLPVLDSMLLPPGVHAGVRVPPGLRAVAVKIDESSGVDNHLEPGCHVDVVGVFTIQRDHRRETIARTILEDVEVAAVGQRLAPTAPTPGDEKDKKSGKRERPARAVTLLVKPGQVPTLHLAEQKGKLKLSMRGALDGSGSQWQSAAIGEDDLLGLNRPGTGPEPKPSWGEQLNEIMNSFWQKNEPELAPEPAPEPEPGPQLAWTMVVRNGDECQVLGWMDMDDFQAIEISSGGPNIFQDEPKFPPPRPPISGSQSKSKVDEKSQSKPPKKAESKSQPDSGGEPDAESETESEPKELFE